MTFPRHALEALPDEIAEIRIIAPDDDGVWLVGQEVADNMEPVPVGFGRDQPGQKNVIGSEGVGLASVEHGIGSVQAGRFHHLEGGRYAGSEAPQHIAVRGAGADHYGLTSDIAVR